MSNKIHAIPQVMSALDSVSIEYQSALAFHQNGQLAEAQALYEKILKKEPNHSDSLHLLGVIFCQTKQLQRAVDSIDKAIKINPSNEVFYSNRGNVLSDLKQLDAAVASYDEAIKLDPSYAEAYFNRGNALQDLKQLNAAVASYDKAIELVPGYTEAYYNRGNALKELKQFDVAVASYDEAIKSDPSYAEAYSNRGNALQDLKQLDAAVASYDRAIQLKPDYAEAYYNRGNVLKNLKQLSAAVASYDKATQLKQDYASAYWNKSLALLQVGDFDRGWELYEWRWKKDDLNFRDRGFTKPLWLGIESLQSKTILIHAEQGLGDTIQFCRYVKSVTALGAKVIFEVQPVLVSLMREPDLPFDIYAKGAALPDFDYHCPLMSLPLALQNKGNTVIPTSPYIKIDDTRVQKWRSHFDNEQFNIGINWQGSKKKIDIGRSFPLALFEGIASLSKVKLFSLQKNEGTEQLNDLPKGMVIESFGGDVDSEGAFLDTAAIIKSLDLIITSDTAVAHLAGALGCRVWLALKWVPDWRWMLDGDSSSWYPSMRLFRQNKADDWEGVFDEIKSELNLLMQENG